MKQFSSPVLRGAAPLFAMRAAAVVVVLAAGFAGWRRRTTSAPAPRPWFVAPSEQVPRRPWASFVEAACGSDWIGTCDDVRDPARLIAQSATPIVLTGAPSSAWPALLRWRNSSYLAEAVPAIGTSGVPVLRSAERPAVFVYQRGDRILGRTGAVTPATFWQQDTFAEGLGPDIFFDDRRAPAAYFSHILGTETQFGDNEIASLSQDARPRDPFQIAGGPHTTLWMGNRGPTANTHYDAQINFVAQVVGTKRWVVFGPEQWPDMHVHPFFHPRFRQSQRFYGEPGVVPGGSAYIEAAVEARYVIDLQPGEVLFLPAFWFHRVEALSSPTISVASWSDIEGQSEVEAIIAFRLPRVLQPVAGEGDGYATRLDPRTALTAVFLRCVVSLVLWGGDDDDPVACAEKASSFIGAVVESRYLWAGHSMALREPALGCGPEWGEQRCPADPVSAQVASGAHELMKDARELADLFKRIPGEGVHHSGMIELTLGDYLERAASEVVGHARVCPFLRCVRLPTSWAL